MQPMPLYYPQQRSPDKMRLLLLLLPFFTPPTCQLVAQLHEHCSGVNVCQRSQHIKSTAQPHYQRTTARTHTQQRLLLKLLPLMHRAEHPSTASRHS